MTDDTSTPAAEENEARSNRRSGRQVGDKRELEQAPLMLRKAAKILLIGAIFPFFSAIMFATSDEIIEGDAMPWGILLGAKAVALIGCWLFHQGYMATHGGKAQVEPIDKLAKSHHMVMPILALVFWIAAIGVLINASGSEGSRAAVVMGVIQFGAIGEVLTLILAGATISHIFGYEHGGKFNPLFPLMFLGPGIAGLLNVFGAFSAFGGEYAGLAALGLIGSLLVGAGGCMAIYTMYASMKQAKVEGEIKRDALREERARQRDAQRAARSQKQSEQAGGSSEDA